MDKALSVLGELVWGGFSNPITITTTFWLLIIFSALLFAFCLENRRQMVQKNKHRLILLFLIALVAIIPPGLRVLGHMTFHKNAQLVYNYTPTFRVLTEQEIVVDGAIFICKKFTNGAFFVSAGGRVNSGGDTLTQGVSDEDNDVSYWWGKQERRTITRNKYVCQV